MRGKWGSGSPFISKAGSFPTPSHHSPATGSLALQGLCPTWLRRAACTLFTPITLLLNKKIIKDFYCIAKNQSIYTNSSVLGAQVDCTAGSVQYELVIRNA
jgi:hypothetical protein